jgi:hypothetical protein
MERPPPCGHLNETPFIEDEKQESAEKQQATDEIWERYYKIFSHWQNP